ncbi:MAG TPA: FecR domain-containing protein [Candidatus Didemnitutus sp.]|nr:FecR domain-containing protein [Candidatus Didemnitutus sp.]
MNSSFSSSDPLIDEQASLWAARLDGSVLSESDKARLDAWLAEDPAHRTALSSFCQFSADLEQQLPLLEGIMDTPADNHPQATARPRPWLRLPTLAGVALCTAAVVALALWHRSPADQTGEFSSPSAHRQDVSLADGSHIELNAGTSLSVDLKRAERHLKLASGEAFFEVTKDPTRPFIVETPAGTVRVTGTRFNVRVTEAAGLQVTVDAGSVQVRPETGQEAESIVSLTPRDQFTGDRHGFSTRSLTPGELTDLLAWREGAVVFAGTPLREALACFARYHGRTFAAGAGAGDLRVGGRFGLDDPDAFLSALEQVLPVKIDRRADGSVQVDLRANP